MVYFGTYEDLENFLNELEFLRKTTKLKNIVTARINYLRKNNRNQREVDVVEHKYRMKAWMKLYEGDYKITDRGSETLYDYAHNILVHEIEKERNRSMVR